jgi:hypothetical protein
VVLQADMKGGLYIVLQIIPRQQGIELAIIRILESLDYNEESDSPRSNPKNDLYYYNALVAEDKDTYIYNDREHGL